MGSSYSTFIWCATSHTITSLLKFVCACMCSYGGPMYVAHTQECRTCALLHVFIIVMTCAMQKWHVKRQMVHFMFFTLLLSYFAPVHLYATNLFVCNLSVTECVCMYSYVTHMYSYVTRMFSYVTRMYSCGVLVTVILGDRVWQLVKQFSRY